MQNQRIGVIGGGASGMMAAIAAARQGACVSLLERSDRVGKKILQTGNGRCNLSNRIMDASCYYGSSPEWIRGILDQFGVEDTVRFFQGIGVLLRDKEGYLYPASSQASTVLDALRYELEALDIQVITECKINEIQKTADGRITIGDGNHRYSFDAVILACGGKAAPATGSDGSGHKLAKQLGHTIVPTMPALVQLTCAEAEECRLVSGVRAQAAIHLCADGVEVACEQGELQLAEYGISGIPVFQLSRIANELLRKKCRVTVRIDFLMEQEEETREQMLAARSLLLHRHTVGGYFNGVVHKKLMLLFLKKLGLKEETPIELVPLKTLRTFFDLVSNWQLTVTGSKSYDNAQVTAGGVDTNEVTASMESKLIENVYFAGEVLDVDGRCGGYNLQWAWSSGWIAGNEAARKLQNRKRIEEA